MNSKLIIENVDTRLIDDLNIYSIQTYPWNAFYKKQILKHGKGETRSQRRKDYVDTIVTFDIETTALDDIKQSVCYIWQCCIDGDIIIGRTIESAKTLFDNMCRYLDDKTQVLCFIHNLAYEFEFLHEILNFEDVFSISKRHPLVARYKNIEFRCSYIYTNMSLAKFLESMSVPDLKTSMDYSIKRYPWTFIDMKDAQYCINDVLGLYEALKEKLRREGDTLYTMPLTSTGYTRRDVKRVMKKYRKQSKFMQAVPDFKLHCLVYEAFRGGNTHANRWISGKLVEGTLIHSVDIASSYPNVLVKYKYPWKFDKFDIKTRKELEYYIYQKGDAVLFRIALTNVRLADDSFGCPYIPISKCSTKSGVLEDNGRVLMADSLSMVITDIDYKIISRIYKWDDMDISDSYIAEYKELPKELTSLVIDYFQKKTSLKGVDDDLYMKFKNRFNAIYGLMVQNPAKPMIEYSADIDELFRFADVPLSEQYERNIKSPYILYQWGVWCTCWARYCLDQGLQIIEKANTVNNQCMFLYCDTDSLKYIGDVDFSAYNQEQIDLCNKYGAFAKTSKGEIKYLGVYEQEDDMIKFITHGAKKYAYVTLDNQLHLTCAGVNKKKGSQELGQIENFREGFIFRKSAGKELKYNDHPEIKYHRPEYNDINHLIAIHSNIYMKDSTYTVKQSDKYKYLLDKINAGLL